MERRNNYLLNFSFIALGLSILGLTLTLSSCDIKSLQETREISSTKLLKNVVQEYCAIPEKGRMLFRENINNILAPNEIAIKFFVPLEGNL